MGEGLPIPARLGVSVMGLAGDSVPGGQRGGAGVEWSLAQGSVSSLCIACLLGGLGEADCASSTKSWMLLQTYLVAGREQGPHGLG